MLHGRIRLRGSQDVALEAGQLYPVPQERHSVEALEDSVFILTTVTGIEDAAE